MPGIKKSSFKCAPCCYSSIADRVKVVLQPRSSHKSEFLLCGNFKEDHIIAGYSISSSKKTVKDLAILGGIPASENILHVGRPNAGERSVFDGYMDAAWDNHWFTNDGPLARQLEERLQDFLGVKHCILACNGTAAMMLAVRALELTGEVIIPSFTFISNAHVLQWSGIKPVFCDIDPETWTLDINHCERLISARTTAIIGTHLWGRACDIDPLQALANRHNVHLLFDAAHAFGCTYQGEMIGRFADAEIFSFHATKVFNTFEGGAITTNNDDLAKQLSAIRNFGFTGLDRVEMLGTNAKMPESSAAMGLTNLRSIDQFMDRNKSCHDLYQSELRDIPGVRMYSYPLTEKLNYHYVPVEISRADFGLSRDTLMNILHAEHIFARRYFYPGSHRMEPYQSLFPDLDHQLPHTNSIAMRTLNLPTGPSMSDEQILQVCALIRFATENAEAISSALVVDSIISGQPR